MIATSDPLMPPRNAVSGVVGVGCVRAKCSDKVAKKVSTRTLPPQAAPSRKSYTAVYNLSNRDSDNSMY